MSNVGVECKVGLKTNGYSCPACHQTMCLVILILPLARLRKNLKAHRYFRKFKRFLPFSDPSEDGQRGRLRMTRMAPFYCGKTRRTEINKLDVRSTYAKLNISSMCHRLKNVEVFSYTPTFISEPAYLRNCRTISFWDPSRVCFSCWVRMTKWYGSAHNSRKKR